LSAAFLVASAFLASAVGGLGLVVVWSLVMSSRRGASLEVGE